MQYRWQVAERDGEVLGDGFELGRWTRQGTRRQGRRIVGSLQGSPWSGDQGQVAMCLKIPL